MAHPRLDENSPIPLHVQLKNILSEQIMERQYTDKIPSELELMDQFSTSRATVRAAISSLVKEGILVKKPGKGTFVSIKPVQEWLGKLSSFTETVRNMKMTPRFKLIRQGKSSTPPFIASLLEEETFYYIDRLLFANNIPVAVEKQYYSLTIGQKLAQYDLSTATFYDILENDIGVILSEADQSISAGSATKEEGELLGVSEGSSVLRIERLIKDPEGKPIEYLMGCFRADMYSLRVKMARRQR